MNDNSKPLNTPFNTTFVVRVFWRGQEKNSFFLEDARWLGEPSFLLSSDFHAA
jgi:hypothetical protein